MDVAEATQEGGEEDFIELREMRTLIHDKIVHTLTIWPYLSQSMLQVGIGTSLSPKLWHPILNKLVEEGRVIKEDLRAKSSIGRDQSYTILRLNTTPRLER